MSLSRLIIIGGPARGQVVSVDGPITIGRDPSCSVPIADLAMSRHHCEVETTAGGTTVRDLESRNGTQVNGLPIRTHRLSDGDQIRIGDSVLLYSTSGAATAEVAPPVEASPAGAPAASEPLDGGRFSFTTDQAVQHALVGQSPGMEQVRRQIARVGPTESTVLITGESGTGKELVARAIHANSQRAGGPFVAINCAAVPDGLMESELFGHERGAFTGALGQQRGRIEGADHGTIFLDEIVELPLPLQAKLLRLLEERTLDRAGGAEPVAVDIRVVAATDRDLAEAVKEGSFRGDLYYRLNVVSITVPPIRERPGDVALLMAYFVRKHAARCKRRVRGLTREARAHLARHHWPGNVRELENAIEHALVMSEGDWIDVGDLPEHLIETHASDSANAGYHARVNHAKRETVRQALEQAGGNVTLAARELQLQPTYLRRLMKNLGVRNEGA